MVYFELNKPKLRDKFIVEMLKITVNNLCNP